MDDEGRPPWDAGLPASAAAILKTFREQLEIAILDDEEWKQKRAMDEVQRCLADLIRRLKGYV